MVMFLKNRQKPNSRIDTLVGAETTIEGHVNFSGGLRVDGCVRGDVRESGDKPGTLVLSENGRIEGAIHVSHAVINGTVVGPVSTSTSVELQAKSRVTGDVYYKVLEIHMGAVVEGKLIHMNESSHGDPLNQPSGLT
jgi:cytoskeletal protein CcmA (bactofilin family)